MEDVLVTGFDPFGGELRNAGWEALRGLAGLELPGARLHLAELPTSFRGAPFALDALLASLSPIVLLGVGQAGDEDSIAIETVFANRLEARIADNEGAILRGEPVVSGGPEALEASWDAPRLVALLRARGHAAHASSDAGRFVCNAYGYHLAQRAARSASIRVTGFVHVPRLHGLDARAAHARTVRTRSALALVIRDALDQARGANVA